jgi:predicted RNA-binding protein
MYWKINMKKNYYLALFNIKTWEEYLSQEKKVYGTKKSKLKRANNIKKGDILICYVTRLYRFVGVLEVTSEVYFDKSEIWSDNIFPVRFNVKNIIVFPIEIGISINHFRKQLIIFKNLYNKNRWGGFFNNSFNEFPPKDAKFIIRKLMKNRLN